MENKMETKHKQTNTNVREQDANNGEHGRETRERPKKGERGERGERGKVDVHSSGYLA